jgi:hypothetical protein
LTPFAVVRPSVCWAAERQLVGARIVTVKLQLAKFVPLVQMSIAVTCTVLVVPGSKQVPDGGS